MQIILSFWINICKVVYVYIYVNLSLLSSAGLIKFFLKHFVRPLKGFNDKIILVLSF